LRSKNIKPCPFCRESKRVSILELLVDGGYVVGCEKCRAYGPKARSSVFAIREWNKVLR
jgi:hypothetical protein